MSKTKMAPYLYLRGGIYYFTRRIPKDLVGYYWSPRIVMSLKTKSLSAAKTRAAALAAKLDEDWLTLRWRSKRDPFSRFLMEPGVTKLKKSSALTLTEAMQLYLKTKSSGRSITFNQAAERSVGYLLELHGNRPIDLYTRSEVNQLRDKLLERGLKTSSVKRILNTIRAIVNFACRELGLQHISSFSAVYFGELHEQTSAKRIPIPIRDIQRIQKLCIETDDEARWLIALISDTGMRLAEAVGLVKDDIFLEDEHPHILLKPHPWRRLKTNDSARVIPLVGAALWAVQKALSVNRGDFLFPKYCNKDGCKSNSASGALNKWLAPRTPHGCVVHSFRHSLRDRLRAVECPPDIIDRIGGWTLAGIGETYGVGYSNSVLGKWLSKISLLEDVDV